MRKENFCDCGLGSDRGCACSAFKVKFHSLHELAFPRGCRFGVLDITNGELVYTSDLMLGTIAKARTKGYYRFIIQP